MMIPYIVNQKHSIAHRGFYVGFNPLVAAPPKPAATDAQLRLAESFLESTEPSFHIPLWP